MTTTTSRSDYGLEPAGQPKPVGLPEGTKPLAAAENNPFERDRFLLKQKHLSLTDKYVVFDEQDRQILFVRREAHHLRNIGALLGGIFTGLIVGGVFIFLAAIINDDLWSVVVSILGGVAGIAAALLVGVFLLAKRHIGFFTDQTMQHQVFTVLQDKKWAFLNATYTAADPDYNLLGWFRKNYLYNIFRKRWYVYGPEGELVCVAMEDSIWRSILRRLVQGSALAVLLRTNYILLGPDFQTKRGEFNRKLTVFDKYVLDLTADGQRRFDRRLAVALGVLLDTGERR